MASLKEKKAVSALLGKLTLRLREKLLRRKLKKKYQAGRSERAERPYAHLELI